MAENRSCASDGACPGLPYAGTRGWGCATAAEPRPVPGPQRLPELATGISPVGRPPSQRAGGFRRCRWSLLGAEAPPPRVLAQNPVRRCSREVFSSISWRPLALGAISPFSSMPPPAPETHLARLDLRADARSRAITLGDEVVRARSSRSLAAIAPGRRRVHAADMGVEEVDGLEALPSAWASSSAAWRWPPAFMMRADVGCEVDVGRN